MHQRLLHPKPMQAPAKAALRAKFIACEHIADWKSASRTERAPKKQKPDGTTPLIR
jgi:hypothetical protein